jgi:D-xylose transport system permease protein
MPKDDSAVNAAVSPPSPRPQEAPGRCRLSAQLLRSYGMLLALAALWIIFAFATNGIFLTARNFSNLIRQTAVTGVLAVGMVMVIVTGEIDLSVGSLVGLSGMAAVMVQTTWHWGFVPSVLVGVLVGLVVGCFQGWLTAWARVPSFIVTLGGLLAWRGAAQGICSGNTYPIAVESFKEIGQGYLSARVGIALAAIGVAATVWSVVSRSRARKQHGLIPWSAAGAALRIGAPSVLIVAFVAALNVYAGVPIPVLILVAIALAGAFLTQHTRFGRHLYAIGGNPEAARLSGIDLRGNVVLTFCILGALAGIAGIIYTARVGSASPDAGTLLELDAIAACVIGGASLMGGRGTVLGACLGALFMASLDNGMSLENIPDFVQNIVKGGILVAAVGLDMLGRRRS